MKASWLCPRGRPCTLLLDVLRRSIQKTNPGLGNALNPAWNREVCGDCSMMMPSFARGLIGDDDGGDDDDGDDGDVDDVDDDDNYNCSDDNDNGDNDVDRDYDDGCKIFIYTMLN